MTFAFCNEGVKNFSELFQKNGFGTSMSDSFRILSESTVSGIDLYDTWLDGIHNLTDESFKISRQVADGKQADTDGFMNAYSQMYEKLADPGDTNNKRHRVRQLRAVCERIEELGGF